MLHLIIKHLPDEVDRCSLTKAWEVFWHMVSKLMLSVQEIALEEELDEDFKALVASYYDVQEGLDLGKKRQNMEHLQQTPIRIPVFCGAQQPGLTGMVKEGVICRFGELGAIQ